MSRNTSATHLRLPHDWKEQRRFLGFAPAETLHIRRLDNILERPCGRLGENLGHFSSLVGIVVIARKLTYGNSVAIPAIAKTKNMRRYRKVSWLSKQDSNQSMHFICIAFRSMSKSSVRKSASSPLSKSSHSKQSNGTGH